LAGQTDIPKEQDNNKLWDDGSSGHMTKDHKTEFYLAPPFTHDCFFPHSLNEKERREKNVDRRNETIKKGRAATTKKKLYEQSTQIGRPDRTLSFLPIFL
jgi:hypothetical protein